MLYIVGAGLNSYKDLSLRAIELLKECKFIYKESYTCIQMDEDIENCSELAFLKNQIIANRALVEESEEMTEKAKNCKVGFIVTGTPLFATTHSDLIIRAMEKGVKVEIIHNVSISNVMGSYGLYSYSFGTTVSIPFFMNDKNDDCFSLSSKFINLDSDKNEFDVSKEFNYYNWRPTSFYDRIFTNYTNNQHTLVLLDIKSDRNRFMTVNEAILHLKYAEFIHKKGLILNSTKVIAVCRFATIHEKAYYDTIENLINLNFGEPLHSIIIPTKLSIIEEEMINVILHK